MGTRLLDVLLKRLRFRGRALRFGSYGRGSWKKTSLLLKDVVAVEGSYNNLPDGLPVSTDHVWVTVGKQFDEADLQPDDVVEFDARVRWYRKGGGCDLKLSNHTKLSVVRRAVGVDGPTGTVMRQRGRNRPNS